MIGNLLDELLAITAAMRDSINEEDYDRLNELVEMRQQVMERVEQHKALTSDCNYSEQERQMLREALSIDNEIAGKLAESIAKNKMERKQIKDRKLVTKKYENPQNMTNGAFIDVVK